MENLLDNNIFSGFIGAIIGAFVVLIATFIQNRHASRLQKCAFEEQNNILKNTFENGIKTLIYEKYIEKQLRFLDKLGEIVIESGNSVFWNPSRYCTEWRDILINFGKTNFISNLSVSKNQLFGVLNNFTKLVKDYSFLGEAVSVFDSIIPFRIELKNAFDCLIKKSDKLSEKPNNTELDLLKEEIESFQKALSLYKDWIDKNTELIKRQQETLYNIKKQ